jgi:hypothetical protein
MKTKLTFVLVSSILLIGCSTIERKENDLKELNLNGKVKSVREISYKAIYNLGEIIKGERQREQKFDWDKYILFDTVGNKIEKYFYYSSGSLYIKYTFEYNNKGILTGISKFNSDSTLNRSSVYKYDDNENLIEINRYKPDKSLDKKSIYKYDDNRNLIEENEYKSDGSLDVRKTYKYDSNGDLIKSEAYHSKEFLSKLNKKSIYKYDNNGNKIEENTYNFNDSLIEESIYEFDENRNLIKLKRYDYEEGLDLSKTYRYEYDNNKNWINKIVFHKEVPKYILEREIEYYD